jgi:hypothetical protein
MVQPSTLNHDRESGGFARLLERIRTGPDRLCLDDTDTAAEDELVIHIGRKVLNRAGLAKPAYVYHLWFLRELARILRRNIGPELEAPLELLILKWSLRGLDPNLLQELVCHCYSELSGGRSAGL